MAQVKYLIRERNLGPCIKLLDYWLILKKNINFNFHQQLSGPKHKRKQNNKFGPEYISWWNKKLIGQKIPRSTVEWVLDDGMKRKEIRHQDNPTQRPRIYVLQGRAPGPRDLFLCWWGPGVKIISWTTEIRIEKLIKGNKSLNVKLIKSKRKDFIICHSRDISSVSRISVIHLRNYLKARPCFL